MPYKAAHRFSLMRKTRAVFFMLIILGGLQLYFYFQKTPEVTDFVHYDRTLQAQLDSIKALDKKKKFSHSIQILLLIRVGIFLV